MKDLLQVGRVKPDDLSEVVSMSMTQATKVVNTSEGREEMPRLNAWRSLYKTTLNVLDNKSCHTAIKSKGRQKRLYRQED